MEWEDPTHLRRLKKPRKRRNCCFRMNFQISAFAFAPTFFLFSLEPAGTARTTSKNALMTLDYSLFRRLSNGASMIGLLKKQLHCINFIIYGLIMSAKSIHIVLFLQGGFA